jgi:hypothetical protein
MQEITPREGLGILRFGMSRLESRPLMDGPFEPFRRGADQETAADYYSDDGMFLNFDLDGGLYSVELARWADPALQGVLLLGRSAPEVLSDLRARGIAAEQLDDGWTIPELGLAFGPENEGQFSSLLVSRDPIGSPAIEFFEGDDPRIDPEADLPIEPGRGFAGGLYLGAARQQIRSLLGTGIQSRPEIGGAGQDNFLDVKVVVVYDSADTVIRLTAVDPTRPSIDGMSLLDRTWAAVYQDAVARGIPVVEEEAELYFPAAGCHAWPLIGGRDGLLAGVSVA